MSQTFGVNQALVEDQYRRFLRDPASVDTDWQRFFDDLTDDERTDLRRSAGQGNGETPRFDAGVDVSGVAWKMSQLTTAYRSRGHYYAKIDPLGLHNVAADELQPEHYGLREEELDVEVPTGVYGFASATPRQLLAHLSETYCGTVGFELTHVEDETERAWLMERIEGAEVRSSFSPAERTWMLERLTDAQELERFLHTQYVGAKRFSLEGLESLIPMLHHLIDYCGDAGVTDVVLGMAHRGRLNVLINLLRKSHRELFSAFNDKDSTSLIGRGDVKYHLGYSSDHYTPGGREVHVSLCFNPSHLEFVDPVVVGRARAKIDRSDDPTGAGALSVMIHGDAAMAGQGIVMETLNLAELEGYRCGGAIHIVVNNQVGFTTSPDDSRSSRYASDVVRFMRVPVFHVNADDIEAVIRVTRLAAEYRQRFLRDVCIDLVGYRRYGHNEADEPRFTQPRMYSVIDEHPTVRDAYAKRLIERGDLTADDDRAMLAERRSRMTEALQESRERPDNPVPSLNDSVWEGYYGGPEASAAPAPTSVEMDRLRWLLEASTRVPDDFNIHPKVAKVYDARARAGDPEGSVDWGTAEMLAYASLVNDGHRVRLSGQDSRRGTFSHRHAYVIDTENGRRYTPLNNGRTDRGWFEAYDSPLSEAAVLGFEYGYSLEAPDALVVWEAQFGDFANGAQVIIDQFIASGEDKWNRLTGIVLLLPHGFEGQGPEHSYARLGRFLQLCAEDNMQVCDVTTPAQFFHLLRRQVIRPWRKPLVVMSPKSLLRHRRCVSRLFELSVGSFQPILPDVSGSDPNGVSRVLLCSGRIYYDLEAEREKRGAHDVHIIRLEQLYPLEARQMASVLAAYRPGTELVWVQDEPWNMGAWYFIKARMQAMFGDSLPIQCVARAESASPATGSSAAHRVEQNELMNAAFRGVGSQIQLGSD